MPSLAKTTDYMLLKAGMMTIMSLEVYGPAIMRPSACFGLDWSDGSMKFNHDWSKTKDDIEGEPPYQVCNNCGGVRKSPWRVDTKRIL